MELDKRYFQTNDKRLIPSAFDDVRMILFRAGLSPQSSNAATLGGGDSDLYRISRHLWLFSDSSFPAPVMGGNVAQVYGVDFDTTEGQSLYLSVLLQKNEGAPLSSPEVISSLYTMGFAPSHRYLAKNDPVRPDTYRVPLWLNDMADVKPVLPSFEMQRSGFHKRL
jgi:hypothetical protein